MTKCLENISVYSVYTQFLSAVFSSELKWSWYLAFSSPFKLKLPIFWLKLIKYGCIKSGFTTNKYSIDRPINFYLKRYISEHSARFTFCQVSRIA